MRQQIQLEAEGETRPHGAWEADSALIEGAEEVKSQVVQEQSGAWNQALSQQVVERKRRIRTVTLSLLGYIALTTLISVLVKHSLGSERWQEIISSFPGILLTMLGSFALAGGVLWGLRPRPRERQAVQEVRQRSDARSVGPLIDALQLDDAVARNAARAALLDLLPRLQEGDDIHLNAPQRAKLCSILSVPVENPLYKNVHEVFLPAQDSMVNMRVAILKAFAHVGDAKALPIVQRLAEGETKTRGERRIRYEARVCLPLLQARVALLQASQTLLRASTATENPDILLRPAMQTTDTAPDELLRAAPTE